MFDPAHEIAKLNPAPYNPRQIDEVSIERLKDSLRVLGLIKPVIATQSETLLAGHQRTKSMNALGLIHCPAFILPDISVQDEIRFNQLHNASDVEFGDAKLTIPPQAITGFVEIAPDDIVGSMICHNAAKKNEMLRLLAKFGPWGSMVATQSGEVLVSGVYGICSKIHRLPCLVYIVRDDQREAVMHFFGQSYGKFSYANLPETTWAQSLAQMFRLRDETKVSQHSRTYETLVIPRLKKSLRVLDFGAGQMDYVKMLKKNGYDIRGIEFYFRQGAQLNVGQVQRDITSLCADLAANGLFDLVVCDSVLNSVTSPQAERDVLTCLSAFSKPGGSIVFSGRARATTEYRQNSTTMKRDGHRKDVYFIDEHGFSAMYAAGIWRYQKFHYLADVEKLASELFGSQFTLYNFESNHGASAVTARKEFNESSWGCVTSKQLALPDKQYESSLAREFDLPLPEGRSFSRSQDIIDAWRIANAHSSQA